MYKLTKASAYLETSSLTSIVYHTTTLASLVAILQKNNFVLSPVQREHRHDTPFSKYFVGNYYMSVARSILNDFRFSMTSGVTLVLNGDKFNEHYKSYPLNYFTTMDEESQGDYFIRPVEKRSDEMEDRIVSKRQVIPNAESYIKEIHIYPLKFWSREYDFVQEEKDLLEKQKAKIYFYDNRKYYKFLNKKKAYRFDEYYKKYHATPEGANVKGK